MSSAANNPYESPAPVPATPLANSTIESGLGVTRALVIICGVAAAFTLVGACVGAMLGLVAPGYYRTVLGDAWKANIDPVHVGFGLGLLQGAVVGLIVGIVAVVAAAISRRGPHPLDAAG